MEKFKQFFVNIKDFITKYWKVIVVCICALLLLGQCSSCNRDNRVERKTAEIGILNNRIDSLHNEISHLQLRLGDAQSHNDNFTNIATGNQADLLKQLESKNSEIIELNKKINNLTSKVNSLTNENNNLRQDNIKLNKEVVDLMSKLNK